VLNVTRTLLLDLDGTLVDSVPDIAAAVNRLGMTPRFSDEEVTRMVGDGVDALLQRACAARGQAVTQQISSSFKSDYHAHAADNSRVYDGVLPTLRNMVVDGWCVAVCTNKPEEMARSILQKLGFAGLISAIGGGDSFPVRKPDPGHLIATLRAADGTLEQAVMVGDHFNDVTAARAAGIPCIFAGWGYGPITMSAGASAIAMQFSDVHGLAARLLAPQQD
jgi:phosphoglycolate phosphatase